ncbi:MAG: hypothetical protein LBG81_01340 [Coriobacteriaceae bacterium]|jgi:hypothetical protein|nr:hypothetical protein [Coriobacteriaceae bacterium]
MPKNFIYIPPSFLRYNKQNTFRPKISIQSGYHKLFGVSLTAGAYWLKNISLLCRRQARVIFLKSDAYDSTSFPGWHQVFQSHLPKCPEAAAVCILFDMAGFDGFDDAGA